MHFFPIFKSAFGKLLFQSASVLKHFIANIFVTLFGFFSFRFSATQILSGLETGTAETRSCREWRHAETAETCPEWAPPRCPTAAVAATAGVPAEPSTETVWPLAAGLRLSAATTAAGRRPTAKATSTPEETGGQISAARVCRKTGSWKWDRETIGRVTSGIRWTGEVSTEAQFSKNFNFWGCKMMNFSMKERNLYCNGGNVIDWSLFELLDW